MIYCVANENDMFYVVRLFLFNKKAICIKNNIEFLNNIKNNSQLCVTFQ